jgi:RNase P subunit RPR2
MLGIFIILQSLMQLLKANGRMKGIPKMSRNKSFCNQCSETTIHEYEYQRYEGGALVIDTCLKCGNKVESFRKYQD